MIITNILHILFTWFDTIASGLPTLPAIPSAVSSGGTWIIDTIGGVISILNFIYSPTLLAAIVVIAVALLAFDTVYNVIMWVIRKVPILNVH